MPEKSEVFYYLSVFKLFLNGHISTIKPLKTIFTYNNHCPA